MQPPKIMKLSNLFTKNINYFQAKNLDSTCQKIHRFNNNLGIYLLLLSAACMGGLFFGAIEGKVSRFNMGSLGGSMFSLGACVLVKQTLNDIAKDCEQIIARGE